jgi:hypothetical protein
MKYELQRAKQHTFLCYRKKHVTKILDLVVAFLTPSYSSYHSTPTHLLSPKTYLFFTTMAQLITDLLAFTYEYFFFITVGALFLVFAILFRYLDEQEPLAPKRQVRKTE